MHVVQVTFPDTRTRLSKVAELLQPFGGGGVNLGENTAIRLFDKTGELARVALRFDRLAQKKKKISFAWMCAAGLRRRLLFWSYQKKERRMLGLKKRAVGLVADGLRYAMEEMREVAVEDTPNCFRYVRRVEALDLARCVSQATRIQIHIFKPCDLLCERKDVVAIAYLL